MAKLFKYGPISLGSRTTGHTLGSQHQGKPRQRGVCAADTIRSRVDGRMSRAAAALDQLLRRKS